MRGKVTDVIVVGVEWRTGLSPLGGVKTTVLAAPSTWVVKSSWMATGLGIERRQNQEIQSSVTEETPVTEQRVVCSYRLPWQGTRWSYVPTQGPWSEEHISGEMLNPLWDPWSGRCLRDIQVKHRKWLIIQIQGSNL